VTTSEEDAELAEFKALRRANRAAPTPRVPEPWLQQASTIGPGLTFGGLIVCRHLEMALACLGLAHDASELAVRGPSVN
jgi:hypothetical protein